MYFNGIWDFIDDFSSSGSLGIVYEGLNHTSFSTFHGFCHCERFCMAIYGFVTWFIIFKVGEQTKPLARFAQISGKQLFVLHSCFLDALPRLAILLCSVLVALAVTAQQLLGGCVA